MPALSVLTAGQWTLLGVLLGAGCALAAAHGQWYSALTLFLLNRLCDGIDGAVARHQHTQSDRGGYLDLMADFAVYAALPLALAHQNPILAWPCAMLLASFYLNAASWMLLAALIKNHPQRLSLSMPGGLIEGGETILFYTLFLLFPHHLVLLMFAMAMLTVCTVGQRLWWAFNHL
ncbi:MAG: hypothetical protein RLZZ502_1074 [Pseudomonadota bacterium]|jgi:phosphatidylglycerophosphate synthase